MKLLTQDLRKKLPALYTQENEKDPVVYAKFFLTWGSWYWYATEFDGNDLFFGLVDGLESEWGYFSLSELEAGRGRAAVERDLHFTPCRLSEARKRA